MRTRNGTEDVTLLLLVSLALASLLLASVPARGFTPGRADFSIEVAGVASPYDVIGAYVLPGELRPYGASLRVPGMDVIDAPLRS